MSTKALSLVMTLVAVSWSAVLMSESFEDVGYENSWTETVDAGCTVDQDNVGPGTIPSGAGAQTLRIAKVVGITSCYTKYTNDVDRTTLYCRYYLYVDTTNLAPGENSGAIFFVGNSSESGIFANFLQRSAGGELQLLYRYHTGAAWTAIVTPSISYNTWHRVELVIDTDYGYVECRLNGVAVGSVSSTTFRGTPRMMIVGGYVATASISYDVHIDGVEWNDLNWPMAIGDPLRITAHVVRHSTIAYYGMMSILRYKIGLRSNDTNSLWLCHGRETAPGTDVWTSANRGATWSAVGTRDLNFHAGIWMGGNNQIHIGGRDGDNGQAEYYRYAGGTWAATVGWNDYGGSAGSNASVYADAESVYVVTRSSAQIGGGRYDRVYWRVSADSGATWSDSTLLVTASHPYWKRVGVGAISGRAAVWVWDVSNGGSNIRLFRWNGAAFDSVAGTFATANDSGATRQFMVLQTTNGTIHCVYKDSVSAGEWRLWHRYRTLAQAWSAPISVALVDNADLTDLVLTRHRNDLLVCHTQVISGVRRVVVRRWASGWSTIDTLSVPRYGNVGSVSAPEEIFTPRLPTGYVQEGGSNRYVRFESIGVPYPASPTLDSTNPTGGLPAGGDTVQIRGRHLGFEAGTVTGGAAWTVASWSDTMITAVSAAGNDTVDIVIADAAGYTDTLPWAWRYGSATTSAPRRRPAFRFSSGFGF